MIPDLKMPEGAPTQQDYVRLGEWMMAMGAKRREAVRALNEAYADLIDSTAAAFLGKVNAESANIRGGGGR